MIAYAKKKNIGVVISTNMHFIDAEKLLQSRVDHLIVAIDGISQETYETVRVRGDFSRAFRNMELVLATRKEHNCSLPFVEWQYIITKDTYREVSMAEKLAEEIGVDCFNCIPDGCGRFDEETRESKYARKLNLIHKLNLKSLKNLKVCYWLWCFTLIEWEGSVFPCCSFHSSHKLAFGNISRESFGEVWNGNYYVSARSSFKKNNTAAKRRKLVGFVPKSDVVLDQNAEYIDTVCHHCSNYDYFR